MFKLIIINTLCCGIIISGTVAYYYVIHGNIFYNLLFSFICGVFIGLLALKVTYYTLGVINRNNFKTGKHND